MDATDKSFATANSGKGGGREKLTTHTGNRKGYAGREFDDSIDHMSYHVRSRIFNREVCKISCSEPKNISTLTS